MAVGLRRNSLGNPKYLMRFFFPDSQDQVDPFFDFKSEEHPVHRIRQRDDRYAHEVLAARPFDGILISKSIVDGIAGSASHRYSTAARHRFYREGARRFFRLHGTHSDVLTMGDCGAFTYASEPEPPYTVDEVIDFYDHAGLDWGVAPDHIVFGFVREHESPPADAVEEWERRRSITIENAKAFIGRIGERGSTVAPIGVAHGWSAESYLESVRELQNAGYDRIALGGMVPLKTPDILEVLRAVGPELSQTCELHLLGVTRLDAINEFAAHGVTSFDSTSPFRQAFKDDYDNYHTREGNYVAIKVPQVDGNAALKRAIKAGRVDQRVAVQCERRTLRLLHEYDANHTSPDTVLESLAEYADVIGLAADREGDYRRTLEDAPWKRCRCGICEQVGIDIVLFRGSERNKRRGFHNLSVFRRRLEGLGLQQRQSQLI